ncbi:hypothetical protein BH10PLA2_BH10PLA2_30510 [soil metagenome]
MVHRCRNRNAACLFIAGIMLLWQASVPARAADRYFAFVFSSQAKPKFPRFTHVWATIVKATNTELPPVEWKFQVDTISWYPATLVVHTLRFRAEPGVNLSLKETIDLVQQHREHVTVWGPCEVPEFMYVEFLKQKCHLESGAVRYQCIDSLRDPTIVTDCIHSLTDMDRTRDRSAYPLSRFGDDAAEEIVKVLAKRGRLLPQDPVSELVFQAMELPCQRVTRRTCTSEGRFPLGR